MVISEKNKYLFTDGRYESEGLAEDLARRGVVLKMLRHDKKLSEHLVEICKEENIESLDFEADDLTVAEFELFKSKGVPLKMTTPGVNPRGCKSDSEVELIKHACMLVDKLLAHVISQIKLGMNERDILKLFFDPEIEFAFPPIVAINENSAVPHYDPKTNGEKKATKGSLILIDCGVRYKNYCSDITRMVSVGQPTEEITRAYSALHKAQQQAIFNLQGSKTYKEVDQACRDSLQKAGYPVYSHATGHGIGIEVHEAPSFSPISLDTIKPGHVITVEPGIYIPNKWGMRLEDTVVINKDGSITVLTESPTELKII